jgi:hypothetical protein
MSAHLRARKRQAAARVQSSRNSEVRIAQRLLMKSQPTTILVMAKKQSVRTVAREPLQRQTMPLSQKCYRCSISSSVNKIHRRNTSPESMPQYQHPRFHLSYRIRAAVARRWRFLTSIHMPSKCTRYGYRPAWFLLSITSYAGIRQPPMLNTLGRTCAHAHGDTVPVDQHISDITLDARSNSRPASGFSTVSRPDSEMRRHLGMAMKCESELACPGVIPLSRCGSKDSGAA